MNSNPWKTQNSLSPAELLELQLLDAKAHGNAGPTGQVYPAEQDDADLEEPKIVTNLGGSKGKIEVKATPDPTAPGGRTWSIKQVMENQ